MIDEIRYHLVLHYGTDWIAMISSFIWLYLIGNKHRIGFVFAVIASMSWLCFGWLNHSYASVFANLIFIFLNIRGYIKWAEKNS